MSEHDHDEHIEDLDVDEKDSEDVKGGLLPAAQQWKLGVNANVGDGSVLKQSPGQFQSE